MKNLLITTVIALSIFLTHSQPQAMELPLTIASLDEHGVLFYNSQDVYEPTFFIDYETLRDSSIDSSKWMVGQTLTGTFDTTGWELQSINLY